MAESKDSAPAPVSYSCAVCVQHVVSWPKDRPLCVHAEGKTTAAILLLAELSKRPIHVCHVARKEEVCALLHRNGRRSSVGMGERVVLGNGRKWCLGMGERVVLGNERRLMKDKCYLLSLQILVIKLAKEEGVQVTCEVCPHHLFLCDADTTQIGEGWSEVRPSLSSQEDQDALWSNLDIIDCFATDHGETLCLFFLSSCPLCCPLP